MQLCSVNSECRCCGHEHQHNRHYTIRHSDYSSCGVGDKIDIISIAQETFKISAGLTAANQNVLDHLSSAVASRSGGGGESGDCGGGGSLAVAALPGSLATRRTSVCLHHQQQQQQKVMSVEEEATQERQTQSQ